MMPEFLDIDWDIVYSSVPPEKAFEQKFREADIWGMYEKMAAALMGRGTNYDRIEIAKQMWYQHCEGRMPGED